MEKPQLLFIHGGVTFNMRQDYIKFLKNRKISIERKVKWGDEYLKKIRQKITDYPATLPQIIQPRMPCKDNSNYEEWKIHLERHFPCLEDNIILIGTSLGGIFLAKYLPENKFPKKVLSVYLVCPPFDDTMPSEDLTIDFKIKEDLSLLENNSKYLYLLFSKNDDVVPVSHAEKYKKKIKKSKHNSLQRQKWAL